MTWRYETGTEYTQEPYALEPLYFGMELEMAIPDEHWSTVLALKNDFEIGDDCSIEPPLDGAYYRTAEVRLHPRTWTWLCQNRVRLNSHLRNLNRVGAQSGNECCCGMHVHFSRAALSTEHQLSIMQLIYQNPDEVRQISKRKGRSLDTWAKLHPVRMQVPPKPFCSCEGCQARYVIQLEAYNKSQLDITPRQSVERQYKAHHYHDKYSALHVCKHTLEVRIFEGTLNCNQVWANLELVRSMIEYTGRPGYDYNTQSSWKEFTRWVNSQSKLCNLKLALKNIKAAKDTPVEVSQ